MADKILAALSEQFECGVVDEMHHAGTVGDDNGIGDRAHQPLELAVPGLGIIVRLVLARHRQLPPTAT
jgi:hypothetical protein